MGIVGDNVDDIFERLLQAADGDAKAASHGIVYLDEFDKLASKQNDRSDVGGCVLRSQGRPGCPALTRACARAVVEQ